MIVVIGVFLLDHVVNIGDILSKRQIAIAAMKYVNDSDSVAF